MFYSVFASINIYEINFSETQEALLSQTDYATRYIGRNLVSCCKTAGTGCTTNPQQIRATELKIGRLTCNKLCSSSHDAYTVVDSVVRKIHRRQVLLTTRSTCVAIFYKARVWGKVPQQSALIFGDTRISL